RSTEAAAAHDIAAARAAAIEQGLLDFHPQRVSIQAPAATASGVGSKRPVGGSGERRIGTGQGSGDNCHTLANRKGTWADLPGAFSATAPWAGLKIAYRLLQRPDRLAIPIELEVEARRYRMDI